MLSRRRYGASLAPGEDYSDILIDSTIETGIEIDQERAFAADGKIVAPNVYGHGGTHMFRAWSSGHISRAILTLGLVLLSLGWSSVASAQASTAGQGKVKVEWLGHEFYRLTSPKGVVIVTSPWLANPDGPVLLDDLARTDFILVPNAHTDDMGNPIEIAAKSGATVITPAPLGWRLRRVVLHHLREWFHRFLQRSFHARRGSRALCLGLSARPRDPGALSGSAGVRSSRAPHRDQQSEAAHRD